MDHDIEALAPAVDEDARAASLLDAQEQAAALFADVEAAGLVRPGITEGALSNEIRDLAAAKYGVRQHWHKRIVRSGPNTLRPYADNPPDLVLAEDEITFLDFGPVFAQWEADFGRTYVLGDDPVKHALAAALPVLFAAGRAHYEATPDITGEELYAHMVALAEPTAFAFGGPIAGHLVGDFPHERVPGEKVKSMVMPGSDTRMRSSDEAGRRRHWILEVHLVDRERGFGGFYEQLLTI